MNYIFNGKNYNYSNDTTIFNPIDSLSVRIEDVLEISVELFLRATLHNVRYVCYQDDRKQ